MLAKTIFAATFLALAQFAVATPPGCLLGAVNTYDDASDIKTVCKSKDLSSQVEKYCGDSAEAAMEALADICNDAGVKVGMFLRALHHHLVFHEMRHFHHIGGEMT